MSQTRDLRDAIVLGDLSHRISRGILHAVQNLGGELKEVEEFLKKANDGCLWDQVARDIISADIWRFADHAFELSVDFKAHAVNFIVRHPTKKSRFEFNAAEELLGGGRYNAPSKSCSYRLYHVERELEQAEVASFPLPKGFEHAGWRELYVFAQLLDEIDPKNYSVLAVGSCHQDQKGDHFPSLIGDNRKDKGGKRLMFSWGPEKVQYHKTNRRFFLVRDYNHLRT